MEVEVMKKEGVRAALRLSDHIEMLGHCGMSGVQTNDIRLFQES